LATVGGAIGLALTDGLLRVLVRTAPRSVPRLQDIEVNGPVLLFAVGMTLVTCLIFGVLSAGRAIAVDVSRSLGAGRESPFIRPRSSRQRMHALAALELAVTMVLLVAAGVLLDAFLQQAFVDHGFNPRGAVAGRVSLPPSRYPAAEARAAFLARLVERLREIPDANAVGLITTMPNRQATGRFDFNAKAIPAFHDPLTAQIAEVRMTTEGFFAAMGTRVEGREFAPADVAGAEPVIVISHQLAHLHFPDARAVGKMLYSRATGPVRVIGVVPDVLPADGGQPSPSAYLPLRQSVDVLQWLSSINIVLRGNDEQALLDSMRAAVTSLDPEVPVSAARSLEQDVAGLVAGPRFVAAVLSAFAVVALAIAAIGVFGVMSYAAAHRTREVGIRMALGATRTQVTTAMLREGMLVIVVGLAGGALAAVWIAQLLTGFVYDVPPVQATALATVGILLASTAVLAAYLPTRRVTKISALEALRHE
jgi:putative ABC transport system permease protein